MAVAGNKVQSWHTIGSGRATGAVSEEFVRTVLAAVTFLTIVMPKSPFSVGRRLPAIVRGRVPGFSADGAPHGGRSKLSSDNFHKFTYLRSSSLGRVLRGSVA